MNLSTKLLIAWFLSDGITQARDKRSLRCVCDELGIEVKG